MCQFCVEHGDGERWYLEAGNYAADLTSDLKRRDYMRDFIAGFDVSRASGITAMDVLEHMPRPFERLGKAMITRHMRPDHFGQPVTIEECERILDITTSVVRIPCICRRFAGTKDDAWCMVITTSPVDDLLAEGFRDYVDGPDVSSFERLDKTAAMAMLRDAEEAGLMHSVWTFITPFIAAICNCDVASGCMAMKLSFVHDTRLMWKGHDVAGIDPLACTSCNACVKRCPFDAITKASRAGRTQVRAEDCWGCGICRSACEAGAIGMTDRSQVPAVAGVW